MNGSKERSNDAKSVDSKESFKRAEKVYNSGSLRQHLKQKLKRSGKKQRKSADVKKSPKRSSAQRKKKGIAASRSNEKIGNGQISAELTNISRLGKDNDDDYYDNVSPIGVTVTR